MSSCLARSPEMMLVNAESNLASSVRNALESASSSLVTDASHVRLTHLNASSGLSEAAQTGSQTSPVPSVFRQVEDGTPHLGHVPVRFLLFLLLDSSMSTLNCSNSRSASARSAAKFRHCSLNSCSFAIDSRLHSLMRCVAS